MITYLKPNKVERIVLLIHGMQDHKDRYLEFANKLKNENCLVILPDLRGHGNNKPRGFLGGYKEQTHELIVLVNKNKCIDIPFVIVGHSMGSLFARSIIKQEPNLVDLIILSGTPSYNPAAKFLAIVLDWYNRLFKRELQENKFLNWAIIKQYNMKIKNPHTSHDWLSFNEDNVNSFLESPDCGFMFTNSAFVDLFRLLVDVNKTETYKSLTPVLLLSGMHDPCDSDKLEGVSKVLKSNGHKIKMKRYAKSRHEILFDNEKERVEMDIINAIKDIKILNNSN